MPQPVLCFRNVTLQFDGVQTVAERVSFSLMPGETRILLGEAGAGKTVLLKAALGLIRPVEGSITIFGEDIGSLSEKELFTVRQKVGMLFQEGALFDSETVEANVAYPLLNRSMNGHTPGQIAEIEARVKRALDFVELGHTLEKVPSELSGGMRRRVGIARATVTEPPLMLYDSPTAGLDPITANRIMALIVKERDLRNTSSIIVTHRYQDGQIMANFRYDAAAQRMVEALGDTRTVFMVMRDGRLIFEGPQRELEDSPDSYLRRFVRKTWDRSSKLSNT